MKSFQTNHSNLKRFRHAKTAIFDNQSAWFFALHFFPFFSFLTFAAFYKLKRIFNCGFVFLHFCQQTNTADVHLTTILDSIWALLSIVHKPCFCAKQLYFSKLSFKNWMQCTDGGIISLLSVLSALHVRADHQAFTCILDQKTGPVTRARKIRAHRRILRLEGQVLRPENLESQLCAWNPMTRRIIATRWTFFVTRFWK